MMGYLSTLDLTFVFAYLVILLVIGYLAGRKQKEESFLIAERQLGTWSTMATVNASKTGSILMTFVALTYLWGISAIWYFIGVIVGIFIFLPFALKLKEKSKNTYYTLADYLRYNYGKVSALFASFLSIFLMFSLATMNIIAGTKLLTFFTGLSFEIGAVLMVLVTFVYLVLGGFKAVAKTDILQYIAMMVILVILTGLLFNGSLVPASDWNFLAASGGDIIGFFIVGIMFPFASSELRQRVYSAKGKKELRNGLLLSNLIYGIMALLLALIALTVKAKFPGIDPDIALIHAFSNLLPSGLIGISIVLLFAAIMSSLDSYIFAGSAAVIQDFFKTDNKKTVKNIRKIIFIFAFIGTIVAILIQSLVVGVYIFAAFYAVISIPIIASWIKNNISQRTLVWSFSLGTIGVVGFLIQGLLSSEITTTIVLVAMVSSLLGLFVGSIDSLIKKNKNIH